MSVKSDTRFLCYFCGMRTLIFVVVGLFSMKALAGPDPVLDTKESVLEVPVETVWTVNDSLERIPAFDLYCSFDSEKIWATKIDQTKKNDTTSIRLLHDTCDFNSPWVGRLTSDFGWRNNRPHYGVDIKLQTGDSVRVAFDGMVRISKYDPTYGNVVVVRHHNGIETLYAHLSKRIVEEGDELFAGEILGLGGNTGRSFGSHLHFETRYLGEPIDPKELFDINDSTFSVRDQNILLSAETFAFLKEVRKNKYHKVRSGDSLWSISKKYGVSINKLCQLNGISRKKPLRIGQKIRYN